ncbi:MAG: 50S ribosomal protein L10 [Thermoanaerobaculia bacterium]|jgi:large subunit ribosomal protein L10|nr:MAG: 50S ribosomal protein L10 [Thermoanaerobaculia bacterium]MBZ0101686.1 50S ribosomal protein L10 [Thermoanaerobaculia bacterium]
MAVSRAKKESLLAGYEEVMASAEHAFVIGFKGISVGQVTELRRRIRAKGGHYVVIKNRLARRAVVGKPLAMVQEHFSGPTAVVFSLTDPVPLAKVLTEFAKEAPVLEFKAGLVEGQPIAANQVEEIASLPGREALIAKLLFLLQSPITRFVRVLAAAGPQRLATVLDQVAKKKG